MTTTKEEDAEGKKSRRKKKKTKEEEEDSWDCSYSGTAGNDNPALMAPLLCAGGSRNRVERSGTHQPRPTGKNLPKYPNIFFGAAGRFPFMDPEKVGFPMTMMGDFDPSRQCLASMASTRARILCVN